ncbi:MAG: 2-oxo acid dehydrogenase subunit E2 [Actinobacteria bacterium]|nr:2-oxo acid dehydrogenase subunit E2 [Actinomycetota bacterium]
MSEFRMPSLGADMTEGTLLEWLVQPGDEVHRGDIVAVVDTEKSAIEIEIFEDGRLGRLLVEPGETVPVGMPLAVIEKSGPTPIARSAPGPTPASGPAPTTPPPRAQRRVAASPLARRRAKELGVDLAAVQGSGKGGVLTVDDVERSAGGVVQKASAARAATTDAGDRSAAMRTAIGALMARSKREIPHYYLQSTIDMRAATEWLAALNAGRPVAERVLTAALMLKATALAVRTVPELNGFYRDGTFEQQDHVHLGIAVSLRGGGLIAPALHDADALPIEELMQRMKDLVGRARNGRLRGSEMSDPTLTVTSLGDRGAEIVHGVIYPPQVALVGFGRVVERPWAVDGMLTVRPTVAVTLAADHRVSDGHRGGLLLEAIDELLRRPEAL